MSILVEGIDRFIGRGLAGAPAAKAASLARRPATPVCRDERTQRQEDDQGREPGKPRDGCLHRPERRRDHETRVGRRKGGGGAETVIVSVASSQTVSSFGLQTR